MDIQDEKKDLRARMKKIRGDLDMTSYRTWSNTITSRCRALKEFTSAYRIHCYVSAVNNEVDTLGLLFAMFDGGKIVAVPKCISGTRKLASISIQSLDELLPNKYGLMEPEYIPEREIQSDMFDLVIAPVVAFDRSFNRLGMGGGYYDTLLSECPCPKVGIAYSVQEVEHIPVEPHDCKLDIIVTDKEVIRSSHA